LAQKILMPKDLFDSFRVNTIEEGWAVADETFASFREQKIKSQFLQPAIEFIENVPKTTQERVDEIRQWGPQVLSFMKGKNANIASRFLLNFFKKESAVNLKKDYRWTRFRALSSLDNLVESSRDESLKKQFADILNIIAYDEDEYYANQALSSLLIAKLNFDNSETTKAIAKIRRMLGKEAPENHNLNFEAKTKMDAESTLCALNALNEVCLPNERGIREDIVAIMKDSPYYNHRTEAIRALRKYKQDRTVVLELGHFIRTNSDHHLRQLAVASIGELQNPQAKDFLLESLTDRNSDVRAEAIKAFPKLFEKPFSALRPIAEEAIKEDTNPVKFGFFVEALRKIDQDKNLCVQVLASDLDSDDHDRATRAQHILAEVGGLASIQKLSRRRTLEASYKVLEDSEKALTLIFSSNTLQATRGFYFAMGVNITIVSVGIVLVGLAIVQVIQNPENFFGWITPGVGGVFGIILTLYFNGPRKNAQQDLAILMNANMIYLGFLRMINEIDATFKHEFMEKSDFNADTTAKAVKQIAETIKTTLEFTSNFLFKPGETDGKLNLIKSQANVSENQKLANEKNS